MSNNLNSLRKVADSVAVTSLGAVWVFRSQAVWAVITACLTCVPAGCSGVVDEISAGPAYSRVALTLEPGARTEIIAPFYYSEERGDISQWGLPPLLTVTHDHGIDSTEIDFLYPLLTYDRFGAEYRFQIGQLFNFSGGEMQNETNKHRFALFPIYLSQRSPDKSQDYTSVLPFYGNLKSRFFRDEIHYVMMPLYVRTNKRDLVTENYVFPIFHLRHGDGLRGWQFWPLVGREDKVPTTRTNIWDETELVPGHQRQFVLWPMYLNQRSGLGTTNEEHTQGVFPLYTKTRSPARDATCVPWLIGYSVTEDRVKQYREVGAPWPVIVFRRGVSAYTSRVFPFYSHATNEFLESTWYLWPVYKYNRVHADTLDRDRTRILLFLYSDIIERNTEAGTVFRRRDLWPFFTHRQDRNGNERLQILAPLEPVLPNNKSIERNYSPLWSLWRDESNARNGNRSQSLLWNLYRHERSPEGRKTSALFGLIRRSSNADGSQWRLFTWPQKKATPAEKSLTPKLLNASE